MTATEGTPALLFPAGLFRNMQCAIRKAEQAGSSERLEELSARFEALEEGQRRLLEHQEFMQELKRDG